MRVLALGIAILGMSLSATTATAGMIGDSWVADSQKVERRKKRVSETPSEKPTFEEERKVIRITKRPSSLQANRDDRN